MTRGRTTAWLAISLLVALGAAGCTNGDTDGGEATDATGATPSSAAGLVPGASTGALDAILGLSQEIGSAQAVSDQMRRQEDAIAECMTAQGFEYWPNVPESAAIQIMSGPLPGTREFVERYGYGVWNESSGAGGGYGFSLEPLSEQVEYEASMSAAEREAYDTALDGEITERFPDGSIERTGEGCRGAASGWTSADPTLAAIINDAQGFLSDLPSNGAFDALNAEWASCMRDAGYAETSPQLAMKRFTDLLTARLDEVNPIGGNPWVGEEAAALAIEEREVALADLDCQESVGYGARYDEIDLALQQEYVDAHRAELDQLG